MLSLDMPLYVITAKRRGRFDNLSLLTRGLTRGVCRMLTETGFGPITEFRLPNRRRADVMGLGSGSEFVIVEVKSSVADFRSVPPGDSRRGAGSHRSVRRVTGEADAGEDRDSRCWQGLRNRQRGH